MAFQPAAIPISITAMAISTRSSINRPGMDTEVDRAFNRRFANDSATFISVFHLVAAAHQGQVEDL